MPTYGRSFKLSNPAKHKVHSPASAGGNEGKYTKESGFLAYYEVKYVTNIHDIKNINNPNHLSILKNILLTKYQKVVIK